MAGKRQIIRPKVYNIVVVGEPGVGKTAIIQRFIFNNFVYYDDATICEDYRKQIILSNRAALLEIAEPIGTAGTRMGTWKLQMRDAEAALLVYSITSLRSFERVAALRDEILADLAGPSEQGRGDGGGAPGSRGGRSIPICLVGNKSDRDIDREVSVEAGVQLAKDLGCSFLETSAKEGHNVDEAFYGPLRAVDKDTTDEQEPAAIGGFRGRLGRLARSFRFSKN